jgi:hypothetical protein
MMFGRRWVRARLSLRVLIFLHVMTLRRSTWAPLLVALAALFVFSAPSAAQITTADVVGTVSDNTGGMVPGVTVTARNTATGLVQTTVTDTGGNFQILRLAPGRYGITTTLEGFKTVVNEVSLAIGDRYRLTTQLELGALTEQITVTTVAPVLQTERASVATLVDERAMQDLPLNGRNFIRLAQLTPGATEGPSNALSSGNRPDDRRQSSAIAVNGQDTSQNNFLIDGLDNNERFIGTVIIRPQVDSIQEMRIETSSFSAELGRTAGGVINVVTKSGTNVMHGSAFEFYRNETMDAKNFFAKSIPKPRFDQNQFGGSIGGPIVKGKTFFFADYAGLRLKQGDTRTSTVPSMAIRTGNFTGRNTIYDPLTGLPFPGNVIPQNRIDSAARNLVNLWPVPTSDSATNNFVYAPVKTQTDDSFDIRLDHRFNAANGLFARYSYNNASTFFPDSLPPVNGITPGGLGNTVFPGSSKQKPQAIQLNFDRVFSPQLIMEIKGGFSRYDAATNHSNFGINASQQMGIPGINIDDDSSGLSRIIVAPFVDLGDAGFIPLVIVNDLVQGAVGINYVSGGNTLKAGIDLKSREVLGSQSPTARGTFTFNGNFTSNGGASGTGDPFASFLLGLPASTERSKYLVRPTYQTKEVGTYAQYDRRAADWLTINAGLRWDLYTEFAEKDNQIANLDMAASKIIIAGEPGVSRAANVKNDMNNFSPRFGLAATINPQTVLRGGYGISFMPAQLAGGAFRNPPFISLLNITPPAFTPQNRLSEGLALPLATSATSPTGNLAAVAFDIKVPYVHQFNIALQRELPSNVAAQIAYVGILGRDQLVALPMNGRPLPDSATPGVQQPRLLSGVPAWAAVGNISYRGNFGQRTFKGVQAVIERRFAGRWGGRIAYAWSKGDQHIPNSNFPYASVPAGANKFEDLLKVITFENARTPDVVTHRMTIGMNYRFGFAEGATGFMGALAKGWQVNGIAVIQTGTPLTVTNLSTRSNTGGADRPNTIADPNLPGSERTITRWFNTAAFAAQPVGTFGDTPQNSVWGPGAATVDLSFFKDFDLSAERRVQVRLEAFNVFNRANFTNPNGQFGGSSFGVISSAGLARNIQLAAKFIF